MKDTNYITIHGWMINKLQLKGNELIVFAIIYGFSQDGKSEFTGSLNYIKDTLNCSRNTAIKTIRKLVELDYVYKKQISVKGSTFNKYSTSDYVFEILEEGSAKNELGVVQKLNKGSAKIAPNNTNNNTNDNITPKKKKNNIVRQDFLERYLVMFNGLKEKFVNQRSSVTINNKKVVLAWNKFIEDVSEEDLINIYIPDIKKAIEAACKSAWHKDSKYRSITPEFFLRADKREWWVDVYNSEHSTPVKKQYDVSKMMHYSVNEEKNKK